MLKPSCHLEIRPLLEKFKHLRKVLKLQLVKLIFYLIPLMHNLNIKIFISNALFPVLRRYTLPPRSFRQVAAGAGQQSLAACSCPWIQPCNANQWRTQRPKTSKMRAFAIA